ncbi:VrrA/YqfQ family protein [Gracilibacillus sp. S3-1-1]|uniref:VrrA/YqfQ family protein n=1 Tax=Gracilibacillus pellucidus TaxID=3095368 RepID=A0ACC6M5Y0_9BACI|nr:VrrA/YqfQ family protein [Gracilibacillus sp. S3-1-1]MDX8046182.1 VrrA/YqfQ family protein [Gracilibacillus sp. S3-1-1]
MFGQPSRPPMLPPQTPTQGNFFTQGPMPNQMPNQTGLRGIIQRFLPSQSATAPLSQASNAATTGGVNLTSTLNNVQQVLKVAQQATPLIKEYGPMIKNAPKLISMVKALNEINEEDEEEEEIEQEVSSEMQLSEEDSIESISSEERPSQSMPKLFI